MAHEYGETHPPIKIQVLGIHHSDAYYPRRKLIIGHTGNFYREFHQSIKGHYAGKISWDDPFPTGEETSFFYAMRYKEL